MANSEYLTLLKQDPVAWNKWRHANPSIKPDLHGAARTAFSTLHMELLRVTFGREDPQTLAATLRSHVDVLLYGVLDRT